MASGFFVGDSRMEVSIMRENASCFWRHRWGRWGEPFDLNIRYRMVAQRRRCERCGIMQEKKFGGIG